MSTLRDVLSGLTRPCWIKGMEGQDEPDPVAQNLLRPIWSADLDALGARLIDLGIDRLAPLGAGASSVVLDAADGRVVRLGLGDLVDIPPIAGVVQPLARGRVGVLRFEIMPLAQTDGMTEADVLAVSQTLLRHGWAFTDRGVDNVGLLGGQVVVIDPGAISPVLREAHAAERRAPKCQEPLPSNTGAFDMNPRIFVGAFPAGISWADRQREEHGDWARLCFMPYATLEAEFSKSCPQELRTEIEEQVADFQAKRGQQYQISTAGQTVLLGSELPDEHRPRERG